MIALIEDQKLARKVLNSLKKVIDPEIGLNIVDLGLVYDIKVDEAERIIEVLMTLTSPYCPMGEAIVETAKEAVEAAMPDYLVEIVLTFEPEWTPEMISAAGQEFLGR